MMRTGLLCWGTMALWGGAIAACTPNPAPVQKTQNVAPPALETPAAGVTAQKWARLVAGGEAYGLTFGEKGNLSQNGRILLEQIPVSYGSDGTVTYAQSLIVSPPSPSGNFSFVRACEGLTETSGLCWTLFLVDRARGKTFRPASGKYGIEEWVQWSSDERYAVVASTTEGGWWLHAIDLSAGDKTVTIELGDRRPQLEGFAWREGGELEIPVGQSPAQTVTLAIAVLFERYLGGSCSLTRAETATRCPESKAQ